MANVIINDTNLTNIANAIREKNGEATTYKPSEMAEAILAIEAGGGLELTDEELTYNIGDTGSPFEGGHNSWVVREFGDRITFSGTYTNGNIFSKYSAGGFKVNPTFTNISSGMYFSNMFKDSLIKKITGSLKFTADTVEVRSFQSMFQGCGLLNEINEEFIDINKLKWSKSTGGLNCRTSNLFYGCSSLRKLPPFVFKILTNNGTEQPGANGTGTIYSSMFQGCNTLEAIEGLPVFKMNNGSNITSACFGSNTFSGCYNLGKLTFQTNPDGTPMVAQWSNQPIDLSSFIGYSPNAGNYMTGGNKGYTEEDRVPVSTMNGDTPPEAQYYAIGDYWTNNYYTAKFGHTEAVELINSLPDCSALGNNTLKFFGAQGKYTDYLKGRVNDVNFDSSINTLTDTEIAVATAKGWTVSLT